jgi:hypothetical protein
MRQEQRKRRVSILTDPGAGNVIIRRKGKKNNLDCAKLTTNCGRIKTAVKQFNILILKSGETKF